MKAPRLFATFGAVRTRSILVGLLLVEACGDQGNPPRLPRAAAMDKAALYGDPGLLPTREGERVRREIALAGEVAASLRVLPAVTDLAVNVELSDDDAAASPRVTVTGRLVAGHEQPATAVNVDAIIRSIVGESAHLEVAWVSAAADPSPVENPVLPILAALGLGISLGVTGERLRNRDAQRSTFVAR